MDLFLLISRCGLQRLKGIHCSKIGIWKGDHLSIKGTRDSVKKKINFYPNTYETHF